jgi:L-lactate dehydrogenase (cytochrome)
MSTGYRMAYVANTGVQRAADIMTKEIVRTLQLLGVRSTSELGSEQVRLRS